MTDKTTATEAEQISSRSASHPFRVGASVAGVLLAAFALLAFARQAYVTSEFDSTIVTAVHGWRAETLTPWIIRGTALGSFGVAGPIAAVMVAVLLYRRLWTAAALIVIVYGIGYLWGDVAQQFIRRVRPSQVDALVPVPTAFSFPSGHSITAMLLYGAIAFLVWRIAKSRAVRTATLLACATVIAFVGFTRVYLGVHWPSDVLGAWLLGAAWLALIAGIYVAYEKRISKTP